MPDLPILQPPNATNGGRPAATEAPAAASPEQQLEEVVYVNYHRFARQLGALNVLLAEFPLAALLAACKRHQTTTVLTLPAGATPDQARAVALSLRNDERIITAAINLQRVVRAIENGG